MKRVQRVVLAASRPEPVGEAQEIFLEDRFQNIHHCLLDDLVLQTQDTERPLRSVRLRRISPPTRPGAVAAPVYPAVQVRQILFKVLAIGLPRHAVDPRRGVPIEGVVAPLQKLDGDVM